MELLHSFVRTSTCTPQHKQPLTCLEFEYIILLHLHSCWILCLFHSVVLKWTLPSLQSAAQAAYEPDFELGATELASIACESSQCTAGTADLPGVWVAWVVVVAWCLCSVRPLKRPQLKNFQTYRRYPQACCHWMSPSPSEAHQQHSSTARPRQRRRCWRIPPRRQPQRQSRSFRYCARQSVAHASNHELIQTHGQRHDVQQPKAVQVHKEGIASGTYI